MLPTVRPISQSGLRTAPVEVTNTDDKTVKTNPLELLQYLNRLGAENGIGLLDMVENRYVGIKSRGVYETPGAEILLKAHMDIEGIAMDREVMRLRNMLSPFLQSWYITASGSVRKWIF
jgi:argininosuccinate synthase